MKTKWNLLVVFALLLALVGGNTGAAMAQETHYFTWDPPEPEEGGGTVTFTATPPEGYSNLEWSRSTDPGGTTCDLSMGIAGDMSVSTELLKSGVYQVCLKITYADNTTYDDIQSVTVTNLPPVLGTATVAPATTVAGYPVTASAPLTDSDSGLTCTVDFGDGTDPVAGILNGSCTALHAYTDAGNYTVTFTVTEPGFDPVTATASHTVVPPYANAVFNFSGSVQNPEAALHAPDDLYASIRADSTIVLDLGAPVQGAMLTIYHSTRSPACTLSTETGYPIGVTTAGAGPTILYIPPLMPPSQYIAIQCGTLGKKAVFELDAVQIEPVPLPDGYAIWAMPGGADVQNPAAATGAPDDIYATIGEAGGLIMLGMGTPLQAMEILTIYHSTDSPACQILWAGEGSEGFPLGTTLPGAASTSVIIPPIDTTNPPSFIALQCTGADKAIFELDAAQVRLIVDPTGYAVATAALTYAQNPGAATGEPDGQYAATAATSSSFAILLDMGDLVQGTILTVYHSSASPSCEVAITANVEMEGPPPPVGVTTAGAESSTLGISQDFRYVWIFCSSVVGEVFELDAVHVGSAADLSGYAIAVNHFSGVQDPGSALGAPDNTYATMAGSGSFSVIILDLGAPIQGMLTVYHSTRSLQCMVYASLALNEMVEPDVMLGVTYSGTESTNLFMGEQNRYVWIGCDSSAGEVFELDAIHVDQGVTPTGYALTALGSSNVQNLDAAVGAQDGQYATITGSDMIVLDLGAVQEGRLKVYLGPGSTASTCQVRGTTTFFGTAVTLDPIGWGPVVSFSIPEGGIRYVLIDCTLAGGEVFELDAIHASPVLEPTGYGLDVYLAIGGVQNADAATGAPDGAYATITTANGGLILDMGGPMQGVLTVYHSTTSPACLVYATDTTTPDQQPLPVGTTTLGVEQSTFLVTTDIQYVWITCSTLPKKMVLQLDAVQVQPGTLTGYGMGVAMASSDVQNPTAAIGAPDDQYATITAANGTIWLDMGGLVQDTLTVHHSSTSPSCQVAMATAIDVGGVIMIGDTTAGQTVSTFAPELAYRYVAVGCTTLAKKTVFQLDAVQVTPP